MLDQLRRIAYILICLLICSVCASARAGQPPALRCRWLNPADRGQLEVMFYNNPLVVVVPGESLELMAADGGRVAIIKDGKTLAEDANLVLSAPEKPGSYYINLRLASEQGTTAREICVLVPHKASAGKSGAGWDLRADGQEIGHYRHPSRSGNRKVRANPESYQPPVWWLRVTEMNSGFEVAPGLTAGELVVPSDDTGTKHTDLVPVCYSMWLATDTLRKGLEARGIPGSALRLISMFRAPGYNRRVGSNAFGRHVYGDAFDFYIDIKDTGKAADLNKDGRLDRRDAYPIVALIEDLQAEGKLPMGGIGVYNTVAGDHEVTMHLDMRGHRATWGYRYAAGGKRGEFSWASRRFADVDRRDEAIAAELAAKEGRTYIPPRREPLP